MSREYKFRAWDYKNNKMLFPMSFQSGIGVNIPNEYMDYTSTEILLGCRFNTELMQFTGSKDINNIEIYEGDYMLDSHSGCWGEVKFYKGAFVVEFDNEIQDLYDWTCECVIGNIYENPELLEYRCV